MDLCVHMNPVSFMEIKSEKEQESSEEIRKRVDLAAAIQRERYKYENFNYNSQLQGEFIEKYCALDRKEEKLIKDVYEKMNLSVRAYEKILKVARTIEDLKGKNKISTEDLAEAISFKTIESVG